MYFIHAVISPVLAALAKRPERILTTRVSRRSFPIYRSQWSKSHDSYNKCRSTANPQHVTTQLWSQRWYIPGNDRYPRDLDTRLPVSIRAQSAAVLRCHWSVPQLHGVEVIIWTNQLTKSRRGIASNHPGYQHHVSTIQSDCSGSSRVPGIGFYSFIPFINLTLRSW